MKLVVANKHSSAILVENNFNRNQFTQINSSEPRSDNQTLQTIYTAQLRIRNKYTCIKFTVNQNVSLEATI